MDRNEYVSTDATALAAQVKDGAVSAARLLSLARERAAAVNPALNAIIHSLDEQADAQVKEPLLTGPFAGVPFLIKDLGQEYRGTVTSKGSRSMRREMASEHALVTQRFLDAGLVIFGKTNTPEFGAKAITESTLWGPARNPWNLAHTPGGSSGGAGAAVAAGIVPAAGANDGGGSVRIPAACNGLVGLKTSRGVSPYGPQTGEGMFGMSTQGVVSKTVRDSAGLLDAIISRDASAGYEVALPPTKFSDLITTPVRPLRIGFTAQSAINPNPHAEALEAVQGAASLLADLGHDVSEVAAPHNDEALAKDFLTIWFAQLYGQVSDAKARLGAKDSDFEADTLACAELGRAAGIKPMLAAMANTNTHVRALARFHATYDLLLTPTLATPPLRVGENSSPLHIQRASRAVARARAGTLLAKAGVLDQLIVDSLGPVPYTQLANLTGRPAISVPLHWTSAGLPLGVQFVGALGSDGLLLQLAAQLEAAHPWAHRYSQLDPALNL